MTYNITEMFSREQTLIRLLLERLTRASLKENLDFVDEHNPIWHYPNGLLSIYEITQKVKISQRTVQIFMKELLGRRSVYNEKAILSESSIILLISGG